MVWARNPARRALAARRCGMNATTAARARMKSARYSRLDAKSWYRTKRKSGRFEAATGYSRDSYRVPFTVATTLKYSVSAPDGSVKPFAVYDWCVWPVWVGVAFPSWPEEVPQITCVSVTAVPGGPRIDQVTPNVELRETLVGYAFTEMNGWLNALIAFQAFTTPQPSSVVYADPPAGWTAALLELLH